MKANYKNFLLEKNQRITMFAIRELGELYDRNARDYRTTVVLRYTNSRWEYVKKFNTGIIQIQKTLLYFNC